MREAGIENPRFELDLMIKSVTGTDRLFLDGLEADQQKILEKWIARRVGREPLQYILGNWEFMGLELEVGPGVLIPRPETEEVCQFAIDSLTTMKKCENELKVLDLCSGSGAIALGIQSRFPEAQVTGLEWEEKAFVYLVKNCQHYAEQWKRAPCPVKGNVFNYFDTLERESIDLIVSNPPYVTEDEYNELEAELGFEPRSALVADSNGLAFYQAIVKDYKEKLTHNGAFVFEIGSSQGNDVAAILKQAGCRDISIIKDMYENDRIVYGKR